MDTKTVPATIGTPPTADDIREGMIKKLVYAVGKDPEHATIQDWSTALGLIVRDHVVDHWFRATRESYTRKDKRVYYLSMEFLIGRLFNDAIANLQIEPAVVEALSTLGLNLKDLLGQESDAALGNGGLGRLAACFLDSMSRLAIPAYGYGIRYEHGLFRQRFHDGWQIEEAEDWLVSGHVWEFERPEVRYTIKFGGHISFDGQGKTNWHADETVFAVAYDTPITGWTGAHVNTLRLWSSKPTEILDLRRFNSGDYLNAAEKLIRAETISRVLYPDDTTPEGKELRLKQEFFFTSASLQDLLRRFMMEHGDLKRLPECVSIQMNDTHPAIAVAELMRLLADEHRLPFVEAFEIVRKTLSYTNHTLLPEALERWHVGLFRKVLPRHMQIIEWIDYHHLAEVQARNLPIALEDIRIIGHGSEIRMGNLAFIGSKRVNGVSALHTELMKQTVFADFHRIYPDRIVNQTNGITPRRWLYECNPPLRKLLIDAIGTGWIADLEKIEAAAPLATDASFKERYAAAKRENKVRLAGEILRRTGIKVDPSAMFDVQIKRIHEYKRQLLNILETIALYHAIRRMPDAEWTPRVKIFGGKAAPGYHVAKQIIKLANDVAKLVNSDPLIGDKLKVAFLPNYNVSLAEVIIPAADLSEQISTAGMEASGTGNMKLALNGALTIGTLDGANVEIGERVGPDNIYIFGLTSDDVAQIRIDGYDPRATIEGDPVLTEVLRSIAEGDFSPDEPGRFHDLTNILYNGDYFLVSADFQSYFQRQRDADHDFRDTSRWTERAILNTANVGWFSSDRTIRGYARDIWKVPVG
ncbi:glycogen/starch/alpha-glucan phosphorylase [Methylobrevis pamukkalensis]|uniref:Alpha-1,4 glucan phosphorylase n=1 Tax=Methylobrevis pamukkalensis TaxID=1439726 RepID=A0A1E3H282_9HYPH|nr:glycogen/starch/alpha-glucan phosphorylase [Methylobrevis pamukkalensis]ODN70438.1 Maltodextrin phosphorylase [Methylobrevis pamukkalensis]